MLKLINNGASVLIRFYQRYISVLFGQKCRYYPSCSNYALWYLKHENFLLASYKICLRILRCNQLFRGGIDYPVIRHKGHKRLAFYKKLDKIPKISYYLVPFKQNKFYLIKSF